MTNMPVTPELVQGLVDHAAMQSDRWLMIALLVILITLGIWFYRKGFLSVLDRLDKITERHEKANERIITVVEANTKAFSTFAETSREQSDAFRAMEKTVIACQRNNGQ